MTGSTMESRLAQVLTDGIERGVTPGAVASISTGGAMVTVAAGDLASHDEDGNLLPSAARQPVDTRTLYDLASVSKIFTAITILSLVDAGVLTLHDDLAAWLPASRASGSGTTIAHLLSHTSGLPPTWSGWRDTVPGGPRREAAIGRILAVKPARPPGIAYEYSCLGYITAMAVAEAATNRPWAELVTERVLGPLGLHSTTYFPTASSTAPTEIQPGRGLVRGEVHDETAWALGGASGNAGLFGPVADLTTLGTALLAGLPGVLGAESFDRLWTDQLPAMLGVRAAAATDEIGYRQGLGLRIGQASWMGAAAPEGRGHNGFTGTSLFVDPSKNRVVVVLTNRVHPTRDGPDAQPLREAVADLA